MSKTSIFTRRGIFVVPTFNTDYILMKEDVFEKAIQSLSSYGYDIIY